MDHAGPAAGIGYGWVELTATVDYPRLLEKTGGGGGFLTYIAIAPDERAGVFIAVDKVGHRQFKSITAGVNALMGPLTGPSTAPADAPDGRDHPKTRTSPRPGTAMSPTARAGATTAHRSRS